SSGSGAHRHMMFSYSSQGTTGTANKYAAQNKLGEMMLVGLSGPTGSSIYTYGAAENHTHSVYAHTHTVSDHTHTVSNHKHTVSNHTHPISYGIYTSTTATGVRVYVDGVERFGPFTTDQTDLDLTTWITTTGWHTIELSSTRLGRIGATYFVQVFLAS
ncbi:MAG TPA: hypothetical protein PKY23_11340, partial [Bacillota bacterium]|nr:hypothetical protein [Bacillota bacterium]